MYNTEIAEHLFKKYGDEKFIIYCQMESDKNKLIDEDLKKDLLMNQMIMDLIQNGGINNIKNY